MTSKALNYFLLLLLALIFPGASFAQEKTQPTDHAARPTEQKTDQGESAKTCDLVDWYDHPGPFGINVYHDSLKLPDGMSQAVPDISPFWAQEQTGLLFARDELKGKERSVRIGIIDSGFDRGRMNRDAVGAEAFDLNEGAAGKDDDSDHGTKVAQIIVGDSPAGGSPVAHLASLNATSKTSLSKILERLNSENLQLVNMSMSQNPSATDREAFKKLAKNTILVFSAGNKHLQEVSEFKREVPSIRVGSSDPSGLISHFSSFDSSVDILAPSDSFLTTRDAKGTYSSFGGTSGAAPLVTAALSNAMYFLPKLTLEQARTLLKLTATKNAFSPPSPGILNAVRLLGVAERISELCQVPDKRNVDDDCVNSTLFPSTDTQKQRLEHLLNFENESQALETKSDEHISDTDCTVRKLGLKELIHSFLLHPTEERRKKLEAIYKKDGSYRANETFFASFDSHAKELLTKGELRRPFMVADSGSTSVWNQTLLANRFSHSDNKSPLVFLEKVFDEASNPDERNAALRLAIYQGQASEKLVQKALKNSDLETRKIAVLASFMKDFPHWEIAGRALKDPNPGVRYLAYRALFQVEPLDKIHEVFRSGVRDESDKISEYAIAASRSGLRRYLKAGDDEISYSSPVAHSLALIRWAQKELKNPQPLTSDNLKAALDEARQAVTKMLSSKHSETVTKGAANLWALDKSERLSSALRLAKSGNAGTREYAMQFLREFPDNKDAFELVKKNLHDVEGGVGGEAWTSLGAFANNKSNQAEVERLLTSEFMSKKEKHLRYSALLAISTLPHDIAHKWMNKLISKYPEFADIVPSVASHRDDSDEFLEWASKYIDPKVRAALMRAVPERGKAGLPFLKRGLLDSNKEVRDAALSSLRSSEFAPTDVLSVLRTSVEAVSDPSFKKDLQDLISREEKAP